MNTMFLKVCLKCQELMNREEGQDLVEYALVIALVSVAAVATLGNMATKITGTFAAITSSM
jgi:Flp pilus assembly pilin Flp